MFPVSAPAMRRQGGFTLIEALIGMAIFGLLLGVGIPSMNNWMMANKAAAANEFYMEGFRLARQQALGHNTPSRILLTQNQVSGQLDWQVDICFPVAGAPCTAVSSNWSTPSAPAANDPDASAPFQSVRRTADTLPPVTVIKALPSPSGAFAVYYTALGWVDTNMGSRLQQLQLTPVGAYAAQLPTTAINITLAGMPSRCTIGVAAGDSRGCPP